MELMVGEYVKIEICSTCVSCFDDLGWDLPAAATLLWMTFGDMGSVCISRMTDLIKHSRRCPGILRSKTIA